MHDIHIVFDCADPDRVAHFWMAALPGYGWPEPPPEGFATWDAWADAHHIPVDQRPVARTLVDKAGNRPTLFFNKVPEPKTAKNRVHLDIKVAQGAPDAERRTQIDAETARLLGEGASIVEHIDGDEGFWYVLADVEGNEFCVI
jgi:glyoxalase superfamily protein